MLRKKSSGSDVSGFGGFLAEGTEIIGEVRFADELRIDGKVNGKIRSPKGRLMVGDSGAIEAEIEVGTASISGTITGTLVASTKVEIHSTGRVYGSIHSPALIIEEGAVFEGTCEMAQTAKGESSKKPDKKAEQATAQTGA